VFWFPLLAESKFLIVGTWSLGFLGSLFFEPWYSKFCNRPPDREDGYKCLRLRIKDLDYDRATIAVHDSKGEKNRIVPFPPSLKKPLAAQMRRSRNIWEQDLKEGFGKVSLPYALQRRMNVVSLTIPILKAPLAPCSPPETADNPPR
jgi:hypothetical protein